MNACPFDPSTTTRAEIERVVAWANSQPYKELTKVDFKLTIRKLVQYGLVHVPSGRREWEGGLPEGVCERGTTTTCSTCL
ncbi:MAG: hypothetical protein H5T34_00375 [Candidatus Methanomethyliales bacterium]|nr:hypothetical protein [Candidatus Methanomethylicales archaeon]